MANEPNKSRTGVDYSGRSKAFAKPGESSLDVHHDPNVARVHDGMKDQTRTNIARDGKAKALHPVSVHNAMATRSRDSGQSHLGGDALSRADANPGTNPLGGAPRGKRLTPPQPSPGMRSRTSNANMATMQDLGRAILAEAFAVAGPDHPANMGVGALPDSTSEK
jgi:hypothetical protein